MLILFCSTPADRHRPDEQYARETKVAELLDIPWAVVDHDAIERGDVERAMRHVPEQSQPVVALYRGWMMTVEQYGGFYHALEARGVRLVNDPDAYRHCHHLPESYSIIEAHTPPKRLASRSQRVQPRFRDGTAAAVRRCPDDLEGLRQVAETRLE